MGKISSKIGSFTKKSTDKISAFTKKNAKKVASYAKKESKQLLNYLKEEGNKILDTVEEETYQSPLEAAGMARRDALIRMGYYKRRYPYVNVIDSALLKTNNAYVSASGWRPATFNTRNTIHDREFEKIKSKFDVQSNKVINASVTVNTTFSSDNLSNTTVKDAYTDGITFLE